MPSGTELKTSNMNGTVSRSIVYKGIDVVQLPHPTGIYKSFVQRKVNGKPRRMTAYYFTEPNELPDQPGGNTKWYSDIVEILPTHWKTRSPIDQAKAASEDSPEPPRKVQRLLDPHPQPESHEQQEDQGEGQNIEQEQMVVSENDKSLQELRTQTYWEDSPEAKHLFGLSPRRVVGGEDQETPHAANRTEHETVLQEEMQSVMELLRSGFTRVGGWKLLLDDFDVKEVCTNHDIFYVQQKCKYMFHALKEAIANMPAVTWFHCCQMAIDKINQAECMVSEQENSKSKRDKLTVQNHRTVANWWRRFRLQGGCFINPRIKRGVPRLAPILDRNPEFKDSLCNFASNNLAELSAEYVCNYLHDIALPELLRRRQAELDDPDFTVEDLLKENGLSKVCVSTIYNWLRSLGFSYSPRKKSYYVDSHETKENVAYRSNFIERYLEYELRAHRWIQLPEVEVLEMENMHEIERAKGYRYTNEADNRTYIEYHVDDHPLFLDRMMETQFGGNLSIRKPTDLPPVIIIGQDECIFKQFAFTNKAWVAPDGGRALIPKDDGMGVMLSAFQSREFGYGMPLSDDDMQKITRDGLGRSARTNKQQLQQMVPLTNRH